MKKLQGKQHYAVYLYVNIYKYIYIYTVYIFISQPFSCSWVFLLMVGTGFSTLTPTVGQFLLCKTNSSHLQPSPPYEHMIHSDSIMHLYVLCFPVGFQRASSRLEHEYLYTKRFFVGYLNQGQESCSKISMVHG